MTTKPPAKRGRPRKALPGPAPIAAPKPYQQFRLRYASRDRRVEVAVAVPSIARYLILWAAITGAVRFSRFVADRFAALADGRGPRGHNYCRRRIGGAA